MWQGFDSVRFMFLILFLSLSVSPLRLLAFLSGLALLVITSALIKPTSPSWVDPESAQVWVHSLPGPGLPRRCFPCLGSGVKASGLELALRQDCWGRSLAPGNSWRVHLGLRYIPHHPLSVVPGLERGGGEVSLHDEGSKQDPHCVSK